MKTIIIKFDLTDREHQLLVGANLQQPHPERIKSMLLADAARTLRGLIDSVTQERNARFAAKDKPMTYKRAIKLTAEHDARRLRREELGAYDVSTGRTPPRKDGKLPRLRTGRLANGALSK
jgi:hypothetical protein